MAGLGLIFPGISGYKPFFFFGSKYNNICQDKFFFWSKILRQVEVRQFHICLGWPEHIADRYSVTEQKVEGGVEAEEGK